MVKYTGQSNLGPQGPTGATGPAGTDGVDGVDGANGLSAYEVAVANGFVGDEAAWLASLVGPAGPVSSVDGKTGDVDLSTDYAALSHSHIATDITSGTFADSFIPNLDAAKITSGVFDAARLPANPYSSTYAPLVHTHAASDVTSGTLADARIPSLAASKITSGTFSLSRLPTGTSSSTLALGNRGIPSGGVAGTLLAKASNTDYDMTYRRPPDPAYTVAQSSSGMTAIAVTTTLVTATTATLVDGQNYRVEALAFAEGYGAGGVDSRANLQLDIDGSTSTSPIPLYWIQGVHGPKLQWHVASVVGTGASIDVDFNLIPTSNTTTIDWAKLAVTVTPY